MNETLKKWSADVKDESQKRVISHLAKRCEDDPGLAKDLSDKVWSKCWEYIRQQAKKQAVNGCACIEAAEVFEWAEDYCRMSAEQIAALEKKPEAKKPDPQKPDPKKPAPKKPEPKAKPAEEEVPDNIVSLFGDDDQLDLWGDD